MIKQKKRGSLFVLSGPSGVGKNTLIDTVLKRNTDIVYSISATTRKPRIQEKDGVNYYFLSKERFEQMILENAFLEWAEFCDNYYGTPIAPIEKTLNKGIDVIMDIEIKGAKQVAQRWPDAVLIFLIPPSIDELARRIKNRRTETSEEIDARLAQSLVEMNVGRMYDYYLVHDNTEHTVLELEAIRLAESLKVKRTDWDLVIDSLKGDLNA
ncbi:MAG: guanylate kinase [Firmicutes bacterium]|nr:guanylate kinase [Bacillota bacterium]MDD4694661.1 guanylate kinase [Bacillota bacterium]